MEKGLQLSLNSEDEEMKAIAKLESGSGSNKLVFRYVVKVGHATTHLDYTGPHALVAWNLGDGKVRQATNYPTTDAILTLPWPNNTLRSMYNIKINGTYIDENVTSLEPIDSIDNGGLNHSALGDDDVPQIVSIFPKEQNISSCYKSDHVSDMSIGYRYFLTSGDKISIFVRFSVPIIISGSGPRLKINVLNAFDNYASNFALATYDSSLSNETDVAFTYNIRSGDHSSGENLTYVCLPTSCALDIENPNITVLTRKSVRTSIQANLSLPQYSNMTLESFILGPIVDARVEPYILEVRSIISDGIYAPGDVILIAIEFSLAVEVYGIPFLSLNIGNGQIGKATFIYGSGSRKLVFEYMVKIDHFSSDLDYVHKHSLDVGKNGALDGSIRLKSMNPTIDANLTLPVPGNHKSLSGTSNIVLDSKRPYIAFISSPQSPGKFGVGQIISIFVKFSSPIVVIGMPSLLLETGLVDRQAIFFSLHNYSTIEFQYTVELGDDTNNLDYWTDEGVDRKSPSFLLNGGSIKRKSANPILEADTHLNPSFGFLGGTLNQTLKQGEIEFRDLKLGYRGRGYKLRFGTIPHLVNMLTSISIDVDPSCEYEVIGDEYNRDVGDMFGYAVALSGDTLAVGAPMKQNPVSEVQVLSIFSHASIVKNEVQIFSTYVNVTKSIQHIQRFSTCAFVNETISGWFSLAYVKENNYIYAKSINVTSDSGPNQLKILLETYYPELGTVHVSRAVNSECSCGNSWTWDITFLDASRGIPKIKTDGTFLNGEGATITMPETILSTDMIGGTFNLINSATGSISRDLSYNVGRVSFQKAIEEDLEIIVKSVMCINTDIRDLSSLGKRWIVTFSHYMHQNGPDINIPEIFINGDGLTGSTSRVWSTVAFDGESPIGGFFALSFRGSKFSSFIPYNASSKLVETTLESLDSISNVTVSPRKKIENRIEKSGSIWTITFNSVNKQTDYGWLPDPGARSSRGNLPPLQVESRLIGLNASFEVEHQFGSGKSDTQSQWMSKNMGEDGKNSGEVTIYKRGEEQWMIEDIILASNFNSEDRFGHSVAINVPFLIVGAPSKEVDGDFEQQTLICSQEANGGSFFITFRGMRSDPIDYNSTIDMMKKAIVGPYYGNTSKIHSLPRIALELGDTWDSSGGFCESSGNKVTITFFTPDSSGLGTFSKKSKDIESIKIDNSKLIGGFIYVLETRKGSRSYTGDNLDNENPTGIQSGSAYVFLQQKLCQFCGVSWKEIKRLTPLDGLDFPLGSSQFGWSVAIEPVFESQTNQTVIIGSPGFDLDLGRVYVFNCDNSTCYIEQKLTGDMYERTKGDRFGHSISLHKGTLLVGSPGCSKGKGAIYVFRTIDRKRGFLMSQIIGGSLDLSPGDNFGHALSIFDNDVVVCAPNKYDRSMLTNTFEKNELKRSVGSCFVFSRHNSDHLFKLQQKLSPSNTKLLDRFGVSVSMYGQYIIVGQLQTYTGELVPTRPVQILRTFCDKAHCLEKANFYFKLSWARESGVPTTRKLMPNASNFQIKEALEEDLKTGSVIVSRTRFDDGSGGYKWTITFVSFAPYYRKDTFIPPLDCEIFSINIPTHNCKIDVQNDIPYKIRGKAHVFLKENDDSWVEQAYLFPNNPQKQDLFGSSVAINDKFAVVGATNREQLNVNSGGALIFGINFLKYRFSAKKYMVSEGDAINITISRSQNNTSEIIGIRTMDKNSPSSLQEYINELFNFQSEQKPIEKSIIDMLYGDSAIGRNQFYGSKETRSQWISGMYDFRAICDYETIAKSLIFVNGQNFRSFELKSSNDSIYEIPDENITVQVTLPGMFASSAGNLVTSVSIIDNDDGIVSNSTYYRKIFGNETEMNDGFGTSTAINEKAGIFIVGSARSSGKDSGGNNLPNVGKAYVFEHIEKRWIQSEVLRPDQNNVTQHTFFGESVALSVHYSKSFAVFVVGAPGIAAVYVYTKNLTENTFNKETVLQADNEILLAEHRYAGNGALAIQRDLIFVGAASNEAVYVYRRQYDKSLGKSVWKQWTKLRSSEYDFDVYDNGYTIKHVHKQNFGISLSASNRLLIVGSPYADYGNKGNLTQRETYNTDGVYNQGLGKGRVFVFYSQPHVQLLSLLSDEKPSTGNFRIQFSNHTQISSAPSEKINHDASAEDLKRILEKIPHLGDIEVTSRSEASEIYEAIWEISFINVVDDEFPLFTVLWKGGGCDDCDFFQVSSLSEMPPVINVSLVASMHVFTEESNFQGKDVSSGDRFGYSLAVDGDYAIVGSMFSHAKTRTTWDFETGGLEGWSATGDAFDFQPTLGDNSRHRAVYEGFGDADSKSSGQPQSALIQGRYYIGTFEKRPTTDTKLLENLDEKYHLGNFQGDGPIGTLTSDPFIILGESITFLIGGGCNHLIEFVELIVDGFSVVRATGKCNERMEKVKWHVASYKDRAAQIRIVDNGKQKWGHINVDRFQNSVGMVTRKMIRSLVRHNQQCNIIDNSINYYNFLNPIYYT